MVAARGKETERVPGAGSGGRHRGLEPASKERCLHECWIFEAKRHSCGTSSWKLSAFCLGWSANPLAKVYREKQLHGLAALGTERCRRFGDYLVRRRCERQQTQVQRFSRMKLHAQSGGLCGGMAKAIVAHRAQSAGQYVSEVAAHKLYARQSERPATVLMGTIFPAERDALAGDGE